MIKFDVFVVVEHGLPHDPCHVVLSAIAHPTADVLLAVRHHSAFLEPHVEMVPVSKVRPKSENIKTMKEGTMMPDGQ
jgi:hypothetical protein